MAAACCLDDEDTVRHPGDTRLVWTLYEELRRRAERLSRARLIVKKLPWYGTARWKLLCELDAIPVDIRGEANDSIKSVEYRRER